MRKERITFDELPTLVESLLRKFENTENRINILKSEINDIKQLHAKTHINSKHIPVTIGRAAEIIGLAKPSLYRIDIQQMASYLATKEGKGSIFSKMNFMIGYDAENLKNWRLPTRMIHILSFN